MFFLQELPTRKMIERYVSSTGKGETELLSQAFTMMRDASVLVRKLDIYFSKFNLSQLKFLILIVIDRESGQSGLRQSEINQRLDVSKPVLNRTISALLSSGELISTEDQNDGRSYRLCLSEKGRNLLQDLLPGYFTLITDFMENRA